MEGIYLHNNIILVSLETNRTYKEFFGKEKKR